MLDLAISADFDKLGMTVVETNGGRSLTAPKWPQDSEGRLVAFSPSGKTCEVVSPEELSKDIGNALEALSQSGLLKGPKPDWYRRLKLYSNN